MPKCKNDDTRFYKGTESSPKGLGFCAHGEILGKRKEGKDGNTWIVVENKNKIKRWMKFVESNINTNPNFKKIKLLKKPKETYFSLEEFYKVTVISPKDIKKYIKNNKIIMKVIDKIISKIEKHNINFFIVPLPLSDDKIYWTDYADSYLTHFYGKNYIKYDYMIMTIYMDNDLKLNLKRDIILNYNLKLENRQIVFDIFVKEIPYHYSWDKDVRSAMFITYNKRKNKMKLTKLKEPVSDFPMFTFEIEIIEKNKNLFDVSNPFESKELEGLEELKKISVYNTSSYGITSMDMQFNHIKNLIIFVQFIEKLRRIGKLTYKNISFKIKRIKCEYWRSDDDWDMVEYNRNFFGYLN